MRVDEFTQQLDEHSHIDDRIHKTLEDKGYEFLGQGVDQAAYLAPGGRAVLKIFGSGFRYTPKDANAMTRSQRMFETWVNYCQKHSNNPYLLKFFSGKDGRVWRPFDFGGRRYLQIWQEYLPRSNQTLNRNLVLLDDLIDSFGLDSVLRDKMDITSRDQRSIKKLRADLGESNFHVMAQTLDEIQEIAQQKNYRPDLKLDNIRARTDGTPVIVDPWSIG